MNLFDEMVDFCFPDSGYALTPEVALVREDLKRHLSQLGFLPDHDELSHGGTQIWEIRRHEERKNLWRKSGTDEEIPMAAEVREALVAFLPHYTRLCAWLKAKPQIS